MNLKLQSIADKGDLHKERRVIRVLNDADVGDYVLMRTGFVEGGVTNLVHSTFWFPFKNVKAGDLVVIYSKRGAQSEKELERGGKAHFFYWGHSEALWNNPDKGAVLLYAPTWESAGVDEL